MIPARQPQSYPELPRCSCGRAFTRKEYVTGTGAYGTPLKRTAFVCQRCDLTPEPPKGKGAH